jgi:hypothetical protein
VRRFSDEAKLAVGTRLKWKDSAKGQNVDVEDLISTGNSSLLAVEAYVQLEQTLKGMAVFYLCFDVADQNFECKSRFVYFDSTKSIELGCCKGLYL